MKAIMIMFDSLNRHMLPPYGNDWVYAPNFSRLSKKTVTFDNCYVGSMPCIPARRELHTGRYNFLHRGWGPLEPFDDSMPEILKNNGVHSHLTSDHHHYWGDGGCTYHTRYSTWEIARGQAGDQWKANLNKIDIPIHIGGRDKKNRNQDWVNRLYMVKEECMPQAKTFSRGLEFIKTNCHEDNWFLQIETFDPHEPFYSPPKYKELYKHEYDGSVFDWPLYRKVNETAEQIQHCRLEYAALVSMCDEYLGKVLDLMDKLDLWKDTMLIVNTDHGFLLSEHGWWGKNIPPYYNELANIPLFIWDPRIGRSGDRCNSLVQTIDIAPTLLDFFNIDIPDDMQGKPLRKVMLENEDIREAALFGIFGGHVNCIAGRYIYMRAPIEQDANYYFEYTLMPTRLSGFFYKDELLSTELSEPFSFTKGCKVMKIKSNPAAAKNAVSAGSLLFDIKNDPGQERPINDPVIESEMIRYMVRLMKENDAPREQYIRLGLLDAL